MPTPIPAVRVGCASLLLVLLVACGEGEGTEQTIPLADASSLRVECQSAANQLGYPVPCPARLPTVGEKTPTCPSHCVAQSGSGSTADEIFVLHVENFDGDLPSTQTRHLVIEARRIDRAPPQPCAGASNPHRVTIAEHESTQVTCPEDAPELATVTHGEVIHQDHTLLYWDQDDVRIVVSLHGSGAAVSDVLAQVAESSVLVKPEP